MSDRESTRTDAESESQTQVPDPEVLPRAKRRRFAAEYKLRIMEEAERCTERGQIGALLRREGLYSSHLSQWNQQRSTSQLDALSPQKRGRKATPQAKEELARLQRENERLRVRLEQAELIIDVQKKLSRLLGLTPDELEIGETR